MILPQLRPVLCCGLLLLYSDVPPVPQPSLPQPTSTGQPQILVPSPSSNAARLLLEPPSGSFSRLANPQSFQNSLALQQLSQQRTLQDARLEQCREKQEEFEQCFFYGTGGIDRIDGMRPLGGGLVGARYPSNSGLAPVGANAADDGGSGRSPPEGEISRKYKTAVPTW